jgi:hypothetical protein
MKLHLNAIQVVILVTPTEAHSAAAASSHAVLWKQPTWEY